MRKLKRSFKQSARNVIEKSYVKAANDLGWCRDDQQKIVNKSQIFSFIKSTSMKQLKLMKDFMGIAI